MALAIKRAYNLPPHLSYVSTLPDITQKLKSYLFLSIVRVVCPRKTVAFEVVSSGMW